MNDKKIILNNKIKCHGCINFYITFKKERPWGCKKFGFISKFMPSTEVYNTTGTELSLIHI